MSYQVKWMFHPSHSFLNPEQARDFFHTVFNRKSFSIGDVLPPKEECPGYPRNYSTFTMVSDVLMDCVSPERYIVNGKAMYEGVPEPHLYCLSFAVQGVDQLYTELVNKGIRSIGQDKQIGDPKTPPLSVFGKRPLYYSLPEDTGLRYQFSAVASVQAYDPRGSPTWETPPVTNDDPFAIEFCSYHTVLTKDVARELRLLVDILGGKLIHEGRDELRQTDCTYVYLADCMIQLAVPSTQDSFAMKDYQLKAPKDTYHAITWKVVDLEKVEKDLKSKKIRILAQDSHTIITDPKDGLGIPWGFSTKKIPNDPRDRS